jgi:poly-gamma-glutamate synthesis protein (capsule biosynthesis protein)
MKNEKIKMKNGGLRNLPCILHFVLTFIIFYLSFFIFSGCAEVPVQPETQTQSVVRSARLVFIGDVMSHLPQVAAARTADGTYDYREVFRYVTPIFDSADVVVANLETTLRDKPPYTGYPSFAAPAELAFAMRGAGIDIATVANNHICDKGERGIRSTLRLLDSAGIAHTGAYLDSTDREHRNPLRFTAGGLRFALFNYTYGTNGIPVPRGMIVNSIDTVIIAQDLAAVDRDSVDCVIVSYHWGNEYRSTPNSMQKKLAEWTRAKGADLIIGGHPHVIQPPEAHYNADSTAVIGATYYSLGNFVSNQRRRRTDGGMIADVRVTRIDSLPLAWELGYRLVWVYTPYRKGVRRYTVLPTSIADTLLTRDSTLWRYRRFITDSRRLLSATDSVLVEL